MMIITHKKIILKFYNYGHTKINNNYSILIMLIIVELKLIIATG